MWVWVLDKEVVFVPELLSNEDLSSWSIFMNKGGSVPNLEDPAETKIDSYKVLGERFQYVWDLLEQTNTTTLA